jgi:predicted acetyltransferase
MKLEELSVAHEAAFLKMVADFEVNDPKWFAKIFKRKTAWSSLEFRRYVKECEKERLDWKPGPNKTSTTYYVLPDSNQELIGFGIMRFPLSDITESDGGNLFVAVPPSFRRQGNGPYTLSLMLFEAVRAGLRRALTTAPAEDLIARKVIEKNRGELHDIAPSIEPDAKGVKIAQYWINFR